MPISPPDALRRAHVGTVLTFALIGVVNGILASRLPGLAAKLSLGTGQVGLVILSWGTAALATSQVMRWLVTALGSRTLLRLGAPLATVAACLIGLSPSFPLLLCAAGLFGVTSGISEAMVNAQGSLVERLSGRSVMNGLHAGWSAGAVTGGVLAAVLAACQVAYTPSVVGVAGACLPVVLLAGRTYLPGESEQEESGDRRGLPRVIYLIGVIAFAGLLLEGMVGDWSGLLLSRDLHAAPAMAAAAYPVFELATFTGRLFGDRLSDRFGCRGPLTAAGLASALGILAVVLAPSAMAAVAAFGLTGLAVCVIVPMSMSMAGGLAPGRADAAIAQVSAMGYAGLLLGPVFVGFVAQATSLRSSLACTAVAALLVTAGSRGLPAKVPSTKSGQPDRSTADATAP
ncbi:MFS transporter [Kitasatospora sp. MAP5-34]|uniref:MFS transporter n=1 Tax=Kitasatospora sp. MAP5-34 TaxID=3035102 RepID=UPI0024736C37|nr:MFS transporter [Kitasatospora sp. MAP5-34]MDH6577393.1 MFS family permease [Kitasatospora sp. MAP5-34]